MERLKRAGFVEHEPYRGMKLTPTGEREALMNIRRHRLTEVFLVRVMGFGWHEVHDEADAMGAVITERIANRMEQMANYPKRCPHGEPIPTADGSMPTHHHDSLLTCPVGTPLRMTRIADQDPAFLRLVERNELKPGQIVEVESRDPAADAVRLVGKGRAALTIGTRAASKLLVEIPARNA